MFAVREPAVRKIDVVLGFSTKTRMEGRPGGNHYPKKYRCYTSV